MADALGVDSISRLVEDFPSNPMAAGRTLRLLFETDEDGFFTSALAVLRAPTETQGCDYVLTLLLKNDYILKQLIDPEMFLLSEAYALAKHLCRLEPQLEIKLARNLVGAALATDRCLRLLDILAALSDNGRTLPAMNQLLRHPNLKVRSKAVLLMGRSNKNPLWAETRLDEPDARVRANALEAMWGVEAEGIRQVFRRGLQDPDNRVVGNALLGMYKLREPDSAQLILALLEHPDVKFRITAVWVMGQTGDAQFLPVLAKMITAPDQAVRKRVFQSVAAIKLANKKAG